MWYVRIPIEYTCTGSMIGMKFVFDHRMQVATWCIVTENLIWIGCKSYTYKTIHPCTYICIQCMYVMSLIQRLLVYLIFRTHSIRFRNIYHLQMALVV